MFNGIIGKKYGRRGHLSEVVETDRCFLAVMRYIHQKPNKSRDRQRNSGLSLEQLWRICPKQQKYAIMVQGAILMAGSNNTKEPSPCVL